MINFRRVGHEDYEDIVDISKDIWEGTDYLPQIFHKWVDDKGIFLAAVDDDINKIVGTAKLSILSDGSGWLEGLRVHKAYRGQKLAKRITEILLEKAKEDLAAGFINKIAFSTHITNIESRTMMEKLDFHIEEAQLLVEKNVSSLSPSIRYSDFVAEPWDITYSEFINNQYFKKRRNLLPLAFVFQEVTPELFETLKKENSFVKINGHYGVFKYKGEPNFLAMEDTFEAIDTFMKYYLLSYKDKGIKEIYTPILKDNTALIDKLASNEYYSWSHWQPDYLYYVYKK